MSENATYQEMEQRCERLQNEVTALRETLRENQERSKLLFDSSFDAYFLHDFDGVILDVSNITLSILGYTRQEMIGLGIFSLVSEDQRPLLRQCLRELRETGFQKEPTEFRLNRKDGKSVWMETNAAVIYKEKVPFAVHGIARDITERKLVEDILRESEERYRTVFENSGTAKIIIDENRTIVLANTYFEKLSGFARNELEGKKAWTEFIAEEDLGRMTAYNDKRLCDSRSVPKQYEFRFRDRWGGMRNIFLSINPIPGAKQFVASCMDITDRTRAQDALRRSEEKYRSILESLEEGYVESDLKGRFTFFNESFCTMLGYSRQELMGRNNRDYASPKTASETYRFFNTIFKTGKPSNLLDYEFVRKDGEIRILEGSASLIHDTSQSPCGFRCIVRDITERKHAEEALKESEERFRGLTDLLPGTIYETDANGVLTFVNKGGYDQFGYTPEEFYKGMTIFDMMSSQDRSRAKRNILASLKGEKTKLNEYTALRKDGSSFSVLIHSSPIIHDGIPAGLRGFLIDISERKSLEAQLLRAQKIEAIGTLAGGIAHDFNNLLMGIQGNASLILLDMSSDHRYYERLKNIEEYVQSGSELTRQLLGIARGGKYEVRPTDLGKFIRKSSTMFGRTKKEIRIHLKIPDGPCLADVDRGQMEQVLLNLYVNAWQAMPGGGDLFIETKNCLISDSDDKPYGLGPGRYVRLSVTDTGVGMDSATKDRVFDPFFTTKEMTRGTGLGLASVYGIVKNHQGVINVESEKGAGATFIIYLPASKTSVNQKEALPEEIHAGSETILLVDDEETILDVEKHMLMRMGYQVLTACNGHEALSVYRESKDSIAMVILDMIMPDMGGGQTYESLRKINPDVKVLLSSGYSLNDQASDILKMGCNGFVQKPFNIVSLSQKLRKLIDNP